MISLNSAKIISASNSSQNTFAQENIYIVSGESALSINLRELVQRPQTPLKIAINSALALDRIESEVSLAGLRTLMKAGGVDISQTKVTFYNPFTKEIDPADFSNVGEHLLAVGILAKALGTLALRAGILTEPEQLLLERAAYMHDLGKRGDLMIQKLREKSLCIGIDDETLLTAIFRSNISSTLQEHLIPIIADSGRWTGHSSVRDLLTVTREGTLTLISNNWHGKLLHLADIMIHTTIPTLGAKATSFALTPPDCHAQKNARERYPHIVSQGLGLTSGNSIVPLSDLTTVSEDTKILGCYADLDLVLCEAIAHELLCALKIESKLVATNQLLIEISQVID